MRLRRSSASVCATATNSPGCRHLTPAPGGMQQAPVTPPVEGAEPGPGVPGGLPNHQPPKGCPVSRSVTSAKSSRPARLQLEGLEAREVPALVIPPRLTVPDNAGNTPAAARPITLPDLRQQTYSDFLPSSADTDYYRVELK